MRSFKHDSETDSKETEFVETDYGDSELSDNSMESLLSSTNANDSSASSKNIYKVIGLVFVVVVVVGIALFVGFELSKSDSSDSESDAPTSYPSPSPTLLPTSPVEEKKKKLDNIKKELKPEIQSYILPGTDIPAIAKMDFHMDAVDYSKETAFCGLAPNAKTEVGKDISQAFCKVFGIDASECDLTPLWSQKGTVNEQHCETATLSPLPNLSNYESDKHSFDILELKAAMPNSTPLPIYGCDEKSVQCSKSDCEFEIHSETKTPECVYIKGSENWSKNYQVEMTFSFGKDYGRTEVQFGTSASDGQDYSWWTFYVAKEKNGNVVIGKFRGTTIKDIPYTPDWVLYCDEKSDVEVVLKYYYSQDGESQNVDIHYLSKCYLGKPFEDSGRVKEETRNLNVHSLPLPYHNVSLRSENAMSTFNVSVL